MSATKVNVLKLSLQQRLIGYLLGFANGHNILSFTDEFRLDAGRPTLSLITHPNFPGAKKLLSQDWNRNHKLHPLFSNMLPEGALRELIAQGLKVHLDNEFQLMSYLGNDLPGALVAEPMQPDTVPKHLLSTHGAVQAVKFKKLTPENKFSLAGIQIKFSMQQKDGRYNFSKANNLGDWIIKTPSTKHKDVPLNEFSAMTLAKLAGVNIPDIQLVNLDKIDNLPAINLPNERLAYAIKRFDRHNNTRIHIEDFAQVLVKYAHEKYDNANYQQIARILYQYSYNGLEDIKEFTRRLLINILLGNGDAHLKNWSLLYEDTVNPRLAPAYDIVSTLAYMNDEKHFALNLGKTKNWYKVTMTDFEYWAKKSDIPWPLVKTEIHNTLEKVHSTWPQALSELPMNEEHKAKLKQHWLGLTKDFRI